GQERGRFHRWVRELSREDDAPPPAPEGTFTLHTFDRRRGFPCRLGVRPHAGDAGERALRWWLVDVSDRERARAAARLRDEGRRKAVFLAVFCCEPRSGPTAQSPSSAAPPPSSSAAKPAASGAGSTTT